MGVLSTKIAGKMTLDKLETLEPHGTCSCCQYVPPLVQKIRGLQTRLQQRNSRIAHLERENRALHAAAKEAQRRRVLAPPPTVHRQLQLTILRARAAEQEAAELRARLTQHGA